MPDAAGVTAGERRRKQARERQALNSCGYGAGDGVRPASTGNLHDCGVSLKRPRGSRTKPSKPARDLSAHYCKVANFTPSSRTANQPSRSWTALLRCLWRKPMQTVADAQL